MSSPLVRPILWGVLILMLSVSASMLLFSWLDGTDGIGHRPPPAKAAAPDQFVCIVDCPTGPPLALLVIAPEHGAVRPVLEHTVRELVTDSCRARCRLLTEGPP